MHMYIKNKPSFERERREKRGWKEEREGGSDVILKEFNFKNG